MRKPKYMIWLTVLIAAACSGDEKGPIEPEPVVEATVLEISQSAPGVGTVGDRVTVSVLARTQTSRRPVSGKAVTFTVTSGGGTVTPATVTTDSAGRAQTVWTLGNAPSENALSATLETQTQRFVVTAQAAPATRLTIERGNAQSAEVGTTLRDSLVVKVTDRFNNPRAGIAVQFTTAEGGVLSTTGVTDAAGLARALFSLGTRAGTQRAQARVDTTSVEFTATATAGAAVSGDIVVPVSITAGDSVNVQFRTRDRFGNETTSRPSTFTSSNDAIATITPTGALRANTAGTVTLTARADQAVTALAVTLQPFRYSRISAGSNHTCGIAVADSRAYCWGAGAQGALGTGDEADRLLPSAVSGARTYTRIAGGLQFTCAVGSDQRAYCWGSNASGQIGNGTASTAPVLTPTAVALNENFSDVTTGVTGACGLTTNGRALCWGGGGIALNDFSNGLVFTQLSGAPGGGHACGVTVDRLVYCWGRNNMGQLGNNSTADSALPVPVIFDRYVLVSVGSEHSCGIHVDGRLSCWGRATGGQTGTSLSAPVTPFNSCGGELCRTTPATVTAPDDIVNLTSLGQSTCGLAGSGNAYCWGLDSGNLGNTVTNSPDCGGLCDPLPTRVETSLRFLQITVGTAHGCAIVTTGDAYCWGQNDVGQLGRNRRDAAGTIFLPPQPVFAPRR